MGATAHRERWDPRTVGIALAAYQPNPVWLSEQLASIAAQTHTEWICMITLDSPLSAIADHPAIKPFLQDARFTWLENEHQLGIRKNFEWAIALAAAQPVDLVAFSDQDDVWLPEKLAESVSAITRSGPRSIVASDAYIFFGNQLISDTTYSLHRIVGTELTTEELIIYPSVAGFTMVVDAYLVRQHPSIPEPMRYHDHWFSVVATTYNGVTRIPTPLAFYRQHENNSVGIGSIRASLGLDEVKTPIISPEERMARIRELHLGSARAVAEQLPVGKFKREFLATKLGWSWLMVLIIFRRLFTERLLVVQANRALIAQLLIFPSQTASLRALRSRIPFRRGFMRRMIVLFGLIALGLMVASAGSVAELVRRADTVVWLCIAAVALATPAWRLAQHRYPQGDLTIVGLSAFVAALFRVGTNWPLLSVSVFAIPVALYLLYRLRWRGDTGY